VTRSASANHARGRLHAAEKRTEALECQLLHCKEAMRTTQTHTLQQDYEQEIEHLKAQVVIACALPLPGLAQLLGGRATSNYYLC
jgi:hypothetical protein